MWFMLSAADSLEGGRRSYLVHKIMYLGGFKPSSYTIETVPATGVANEESVEKIPPSAGQLRDHLQ